MVNWYGLKPLVIARLTSFVILAAIWSLYGVTLAFLYLASGTSRAGTYIWFGMFVSLVVYFRWPWVVVVVGWAEMLRAFCNSNSWELHSISGLIYWLGLDILLLIAAHAGLVSSILLKRYRAGCTSVRA